MFNLNEDEEYTILGAYNPAQDDFESARSMLLLVAYQKNDNQKRIYFSREYENYCSGPYHTGILINQ